VLFQETCAPPALASQIISEAVIHQQAILGKLQEPGFPEHDEKARPSIFPIKVEPVAEMWHHRGVPRGHALVVSPLVVRTLYGRPMGWVC